MYFFTAYGYSIKSEIDLPGFSRIPEGKFDISILKKQSCSPESKTKRSFSIHKLPDGLRVEWPGVASYTVVLGQEIIITPESNSGPRSNLIAQPLYGIVIAAILQQNNYLVLHGSTVEINEKALILVGKKGFGKSTLTAALVASGHSFISDDVTAISMNSNSDAYQVLPGIPRLKLWPDAARAVGHSPDRLPCVSPEIPKHILLVSDHLKNKPTPLKAIIMLDHGDSTALHKMTEPEKMIWLLGGQYFAKFHHAFDEKSHKLLFSQCSLLARETDIIRLEMPRSTQLLPDITKLLEQHMW